MTRVNCLNEQDVRDVKIRKFPIHCHSLTRPVPGGNDIITVVSRNAPKPPCPYIL